ncbi:MAG: UDP-N-acetylmuramoyl-L-alanyl-D-glutamate--2,6-diaminopimelate ligase [Rhodospirillales bacterium]|nr:UDP-N-acetylmuramoyl-L-alanyl-D-glutamate--2,6-diaminopimelate ligase [Alphaproteobacteria bacterium]MCB9986982.1 UDP-N-acetylmuramoyl-L-alanyl-D-glutamate--2,6-diaminopimelate ligase [Rhodospirillales bacterium]USO08244.1 MAG: UDP-N-acetylmuramoyl-L-alanyl-D-glutamate--2,6-diaminopimelate ligase [Rhodospirillales bacterium]
MNDDDILARISGLTADSRMARSGWLFAALPGTRSDGRMYIRDAIVNGAAVILAPEGTVLPEDVLGDVRAMLVTDIDARGRFARLAARFYGRQPETVAAVTGTNGKTSCVTFAAQLWDMLGHTAASLGTLGIVSRITMKKGGLTTPDPVQLQAEMADLAAAGVTHLAMEASSIGLDQRRLDGVRLKAAAFTNLSHDHLDYHGDMETYFAAKRRLFDVLLPQDGVAVINTDDEWGVRLSGMVRQRQIRVGGDSGCEIRLVRQIPSATGQVLEVVAEGRTHEIALPLVGLFQGMNALAAAGLVMACDGVGFAQLVPLLEKLHGVPGRLELVKGAPVYVDYAHTPHGLETVLKALRPHTSGRLVVVFGCGGDRDKGKRPVMGGIATKLADLAIITDDNPRGEDAAKIRAEIRAGAPNAAEIGDRRTAISEAVAGLEAGDVLVIAGKGHEQGQIVGDAVLPFDDVKEAEDAIHAL